MQGYGEEEESGEERMEGEEDFTPRTPRTETQLTGTDCGVKTGQNDEDCGGKKTPSNTTKIKITVFNSADEGQDGVLGG